MENQEKADVKTAVISYLTIVGTLIAFSINSEHHNKFAAFHIRQAIGLSITFFGLAYVVGNFDHWGVTMGFYIFYVVLWMYGFIGAIQGHYNSVPLLGNLFQKLFKGIK